jgi:serpin B
LLVDGHNDFALALYEQLAQKPRNLFFSPLSIRTALGMARVGAKGETAVQVDRALRFESSEERYSIDDDAADGASRRLHRR